jgi:hypothetical protein
MAAAVLVAAAVAALERLRGQGNERISRDLDEEEMQERVAIAARSSPWLQIEGSGGGEGEAGERSLETRVSPGLGTEHL